MPAESIPKQMMDGPATLYIEIIGTLQNDIYHYSSAF